MTGSFCLLVVAKAPVPGFVKTRLCPPATPDQAADIAAAALLDTLDAVAATPGAVPVVAATGDWGTAARAAELAHALWPMTVIRQRGNSFAERLVNAHQDAAMPGLPVLQIGMDTPQVTPDLLAQGAASLTSEEKAALGLAEDGGWWALGLGDPAAAKVLTGVPMSRADTGRRTLRALTDIGLRTTELDLLSDVDTMADAERVAARCGGRFAPAVRAVLS
ncbi:DUF2064 domain-containing protein [Amycolatopsis acidiphila]|uniref:DUF2064 domain-containing protein n=1 Tax=Amycolatopsis acidiphila TaxID=715473 RepID=A0A558A806_9PSEU|nr:DUF2064 domain-containing protein [Amycolatopsis acidiphila]TVT20386.1 DUF2064 domain-containing protein [Amycolatopsis acidiphila]UIJ59180.1 DUF2064 domain-containing protein [Amycolatopsis acidiphila]GHG78970.1 hypothetical protein GCM10017788_46610 [Amycolatopsis acidiphila]